MPLRLASLESRLCSLQVRGYDTGELATCRNFLETAVELRGWVGLPRGITQRVFAFAERGEHQTRELRANQAKAGL